MLFSGGMGGFFTPKKHPYPLFTFITAIMKPSHRHPLSYLYIFPLPQFFDSLYKYTSQRGPLRRAICNGRLHDGAALRDMMRKLETNMARNGIEIKIKNQNQKQE